ncbi:hypothetical protein [Novosphingobium malaysiense]|uniref:hypothetical protein n=1 Tax=Novosphingobium malaysiense TaxID=1348853 RepID=UPI00068D83E8|nr:hypothetical protein [Novosphingobium malaysiense]
MRKVAALLLACCGLVAGCDSAPPAKPALLSGEEIATVAGRCGVPARTITVEQDKLRFDPPKGMAQSKQACVLAELRARLPNVSISYPALIQGQTRKDETKP